MYKLFLFLRSIQVPNRIFGIPWILKLYKSKTRRISGHPYILKGTVLAERRLQLIFGSIVSQITHVDLALQIPVPVS